MRCACGSGKLYSQCCGNLTAAAFAHADANVTGNFNNYLHDALRRASRHNVSKTLKERAILTYEAIGDIFKINKGKTWDEFRRDISDDQIKAFYCNIAKFWPSDTDLNDLLPNPSNNLRALYVGLHDPRVLIQNIKRYSLYTDEIIVVNPFLNPWAMQPDYNPITAPSQHKLQTIKNVALFMQLYDWIDNDIVLMIPDPGDLNPTLRTQMWDLAMQRWTNEKLKLTKEDKDYFLSLAEIDTRNMMYNLPKKQFVSMLRKYNPQITDSEIDDALRYAENMKKNDPFAPLHDVLIESEDGQLTTLSTGLNLEMGFYVAQLTGSYLFTDVPFRWKEILSTIHHSPEDTVSKHWSPLTKSFQELQFKFLDNVDNQFACRIREQGRLEQFRNLLRKIWTEIGGSTDPEKSHNLARDFADEIQDEYKHAKAEWDKIDQELIKWLGSGAAVAAFSPLVSGTITPAIPLVGFTIHAVTQLLITNKKRRGFKDSVPLSVFLELDRK